MISLLRIAGAIATVMVTTAAMCNKSTASAAPVDNATAALPAATISPGLPSDFPLAPGLGPCTPIVTGPETICDWHNVDGHAVYTFYHDALPKAGYTLRPGAGEYTLQHYQGMMGFQKGNVLGAVTIAATDLTIQIYTKP